MGLIELKCDHCGTVFYGVKGRDGYCHICKTIILFCTLFGLENLDIDEFDFKRIRDPNWANIDETRVDDWRIYIPQGLRSVWFELLFEAKVMAIMFAEKIAREKREEANSRG